jgi:hypothetical protein
MDDEEGKENCVMSSSRNDSELLIIGDELNDVLKPSGASLQDNFKKFRDRKLSDRKLQVDTSSASLRMHS